MKKTKENRKPNIHHEKSMSTNSTKFMMGSDDFKQIKSMKIQKNTYMGSDLK